MRHLTRYGLVAGCVLALSVSTACAVEPDRLLPAEADTVGYVNFKQLVGAELIKKFALGQIKQALDGQELKEVLKSIGLDPLKDIEQAWIGSAGTDLADMKALVILHGKFDPKKLFVAADLAAKLKNEKFSAIKDGDAKLFRYQPDHWNPIYCAVVDETTIVMATDKKLAASALKQAEVQNNTPIKPDLAALVKAMDEKSSAFAVSIVKGKFDKVKIPNQVSDTLNLDVFKKALPSTEAMSLTMNVADDVAIELVLGMASATTAADMNSGLRNAIDNMRAYVPLLAAADPRGRPLVDVVKTLKTDVKMKSVTVTAKITSDNIGKLITPNE
jgi:hypothetical protein